MTCEDPLCPSDDPPMAITLFVLQLASTLIMVGVIWFVQVVHYPLFGRVGEQEFSAYERSHQQRTGIVVIPPMLVELTTAVAMIAYRPPGTPRWVAVLGLALVAVAWVSTFALQAPTHGRLSPGFEPGLHRFLVATNWIRTVAWTARGGLVCWCCWVMLRAAR